MTTEKPEQEIVPPSWIDQELIKTLPEDKQDYWANRTAGWRGQGEKFDPVVATHPNEKVQTSFDNAGNIIVHNRDSRRNRPLKFNIFTKATHSIKKERLKNANKQRLRAIAKARKARRARYQEVA